MTRQDTLYGTFVEGVCKGWKIATLNMLPNVVLAFVFIKALQISGLLDVLGAVFAPLMAFFGLPGEAVTVLISTWFSAGGGIGATAGLYSHDIMDSTHVSIVMPAIFLMGAQLQYVGRILSVAGVDSRHYPMLFGIGILNAVLAMLTMKWLIV